MSRARPAAPLLVALAAALALPWPVQAAAALSVVDETCALESLLASDKEQFRTAQAVWLARAGPSGVTLLDELTRHPASEIRRAAALGLGESRDPTAVPALAALLHDESPDVAWVAALSLGSLAGREAALHLGLALAPGSSATAPVPFLLDALRKAGTADDAPLVRPFLRDPDPATRRSALAFVTSHGSRDDLDAVLDLVADADAEVARSAAAAVKRIEGALDFDALLAWLDSADSRRVDHALVALRPLAPGPTYHRAARAADMRAVLPRLLEHAATSDANVRLGAVRTLDRWLSNAFGTYEDRATVSRLPGLLRPEKDPLVRRALLEVLAKAASREIVVAPLGYGHAMPLESRRLVHRDIDDVVVPALLGALDDPDASNRAFADRALQSLLGRDAGFPEDGLGSPRERRDAAGRWQSAWRELAELDLEQRTRRSIDEALAALDAGSPPEAWTDGLAYVTGHVPVAELAGSGAAVAADYRAWLAEHDGESQAEWIAHAARGNHYLDVPESTWHRLAQLSGGGLDLRAVRLPADVDAVLDTVIAGGAARPEAQAALRPLHERARIPDAASKPFAAAYFAFLRGEHGAAVRGFRTVATRTPDDPVAWTYLAASLLKSEPPDLAGADETVQTALQASERRREEPPQATLYLAGLVHEARGELEAAVVMLRRAKLDEPVDAEVSSAEGHAALARSHVGLGRLPAAEKVIERGLARDPDAAALHLARALVAERRGDLASALAAADAAVSVQPAAREAWSTRSRLREAAGMSAEAAADRRVSEALAIVARPGPSAAGASDQALALQEVQPALAGSPELDLWGAQQALSARRAKEAAVGFDRFLAQRPGDAGALFGLARSRDATGELALALAAYLELERRHPVLQPVVSPFIERLLVALPAGLDDSVAAPPQEPGMP